MSLVDANVVLRYLLDDHAELSPKAAGILERQAVTMPVEVGCEVVYVLQKVYAVERKEIQQQLSALLNEGLVSMDKPAVFLKALDCYGDSTLDFVDSA
jgi:predicted nucleic-acid-binding protein